MAAVLSGESAERRGAEAATVGVLGKKGVLKNFTNFTGKKTALESLFDKATGLKACSFIKKKTLIQVFSCEYFQISKNTYFEEHLRTTVSILEEGAPTLKPAMILLKNEAWHERRKLYESPLYQIMWCFAQFGIICTILKTWKIPMGSDTFSKVAACNFTKSIAPPWVLFTFFELHKKYQITQRVQRLLCRSSSNFDSKNLSKIINFYSPWNHQTTFGFLMISGGIEVS